jgi:hypothetical protein
LETAHGFTAIVGGGGNDHLTGSDIAGSVDKLYGGPGNDTFHWSRGVNILHGGQPGLAYEDDGLDTVDYTGAGEIRVDALPGADPHRQPDFVVSHPGGQDYLYSIEEILWDRASDHVKIGRGVGLVTQPPDGDRQGGAGGSARLEMHETLSPSTLAPGDPPGMPWCADGLDDTCDGALPDLGESLGAAFFDAWGSG